MERGVSTDVQVTTRHSFEDETMRTSDTVSCKLGADSLVHDQLLSFRSYALQNPSKIVNMEKKRRKIQNRKLTIF